MFTITCIAVGKLKESYWREAVQEYEKRLKSYVSIQIVEVPDEKSSERPSAAEIEGIKNKEAEKIWLKVPADSYVIVLAIHGAQLASEQLADQFERFKNESKKKIVFIIGGSHGLADSILQRANEHLSLGKITLPHQLARVVLIEQIYRAFKIMKNEPYHK